MTAGYTASRYAGQLLSVLRIVTGVLFLAHGPGSAFPALNGGGLAILFCFVFLYLAGAGPWSIDARRRG